VNMVSKICGEILDLPMDYSINFARKAVLHEYA
jgi:hypothetical protein